ncbi:DUF924 family protein [Acinetobacter boissieri]|uniref:Uncharacterized conserved protein, DUF924 family n=1 Tax=Acinetobacter boissieri TaxID=1219383 RepID=A0A1G6HIQ7_9GAMM|nr:DUF924 family protein [Acinetobacter boissieri]SDB93805.1 Uncharacterized conserved protein, DUF924 family [Acinetobacter boissieri]
MKDVLDFWFSKSHQPLWFKKDDDFDQAISAQFSMLHNHAKQAELWSWRKTAEGRLAEIIVLDQFSRNLFRGSAQAFAQDSLALALAQEAVDLKMDQELLPEQRAFLYMPFMHSESKKIHEYAVQLFTALGNAHNLDFEYKHQAIIEKFGRYPHRNQILGRDSTAEELEFLKQPNSHF